MTLMRAAVIGNWTFAGDDGAAFYNYGSLTMVDSVVTGNRSDEDAGGYISNEGSLHIIDTQITGNCCQINNSGFAELVRTVVSGSQGESFGGINNRAGAELRMIDSELSDCHGLANGGLANAATGRVLLSGTTVRDNFASYFSNIRNDGSMELINTTVSNNRNGYGVTAGTIENTGTLRMMNSTIASNRSTSEASLYNSGTLQLARSIVSASTDPRGWAVAACTGSGTIISLGDNIDSDGSCGLTGPGDIVADPLLGPLADNAGLTPTHALLPGSPALDRIDASDCVYDDDGDPGTPEVPLDRDQRGFLRPSGAGCDAGSYESVAVGSYQKISDTQGGFTGVLDNGDSFGSSVSVLGDLDGDGVGDLVVGAERDSDGGSKRGAVWVLFLDTDGTVKAHQKISDTEGGFTGSLDNGDGFGSSVAMLGDLDGDGVADLAVGAYEDDDGGSGRGAVWVLFLDTDGTVKGQQKISDTEGGFTGALDDGDVFGRSVTALGDLDGDGIADLAVGAYEDDDGGSGRGAVWVLFLDTDGTVKAHQKISNTAGGFTGVLDDGDWFGSSVAALGDLDGDGVGELAVGSEGDDDGGLGRGAVWVLFLDTDGTVKGQQKISNTAGGFTGALDDGDYFGWSVAALGDVDGDYVGDLVVGADGDDDGGNARGAVWVLFLDMDGTVRTQQKISDIEGGFSGVLDNGDWFGNRVAALGDLDGDGAGEFVVGARGDDDGGGDRGAVWVLSLGGVAIVCGNSVLDPLEECDDGGTIDGDGCSASCELEDRVELFDQAQGGTVGVTINMVQVVVVTTPGQTAAQVIEDLAAAINADPELAGLGTTALAIGNALVTNGTVNDVTITDPGLAGVALPALHPAVQFGFALLLLTVGLLLLRTKSLPGRMRVLGA